MAPATPRSSHVTGLPSSARGEHGPPEARAQVVDVGGQREDRHHLRRDRDDELRLARNAVLAAAEAHDDVPERPVTDIEDARPEDPVRVDAERVLVVEAVVDERTGEVMGRADRVDVAGQVEVEVLHRDDLAVAAAGRAALDAKDRPERRLADVDRRPMADPVEALGEADRRGRLALAQRRRRDRRDHHVLPARTFGLEPGDRRRASPSPSSARTARARRVGCPARRRCRRWAAG